MTTTVVLAVIGAFFTTLWGAWQLWLAKRSGQSEQAQTDKGEAMQNEINDAKTASTIDQKVRATDLSTLRDELRERSGLK